MFKILNFILYYKCRYQDVKCFMFIFIVYCVFIIWMDVIGIFMWVILFIWIMFIEDIFQRDIDLVFWFIIDI